MDNVTFEILKIIVSLISIIITFYLVPYLKNRMGQDKMDEIQKWANNIVLAIQQTNGEASGEEKRRQAEELLQKILDQYKINLTVEQINILIESAVKSMKIAQSS